ncbi:hypothetical protein PSENEW3_00002939 [Picochlorum sp. SENEW3]|nr:hypothetical protein PSENEW3_00002939 [Picochlorum sp. SENEW3]
MVRSTALSLLSSGPKWLNVHSEAILSHFRHVRDVDSRDAYEFLIHKIHSRQELLLSYNIGLPVDVRERDMNKRAAQLVGLKLPEKAE